MFNIIGFLREVWITLYFGVNLIFLHSDVEIFRKIESICSQIHNGLSITLVLFKNQNEKSMKNLLKNFSEEEIEKILRHFDKKAKIIQEIYRKTDFIQISKISPLR